MTIDRVACIVLPGVSPFELGVACEAFGLDRSDDGIRSFDFRVVSPEPGLVPTNAGMSLHVEHDLTFAETADLLIVAPVPRAVWNRVDRRVAEVLQDAVERGAWILTLCSGVFVAAAAGVLDHRSATTHWRYTATLAGMYPDVDVSPNVLYVQDERVVTSAGTAAGIDACLHLLRLELGVDAANRIARRMVVPPQREGGQAQFILAPLPESPSLSLAPLVDWAIERLAEDVTVERMAARVHMSPRTFARRFKADFGATPAAWLARQRVSRAQRLLETTDLGLERIAHECGFASASVLRQNFARTLGVSPTAYRARFACAEPPVAELAVAEAVVA